MMDRNIMRGDSQFVFTLGYHTSVGNPGKVGIASRCLWRLLAAIPAAMAAIGGYSVAMAAMAAIWWLLQPCCGAGGGQDADDPGRHKGNQSAQHEPPEPFSASFHLQLLRHSHYTTGSLQATTRHPAWTILRGQNRGENASAPHPGETGMKPRAAGPFSKPSPPSEPQRATRHPMHAS